MASWQINVPLDQAGEHALGDHVQLLPGQIALGRMPLELLLDVEHQIVERDDLVADAGGGPTRFLPVAIDRGFRGIEAASGGL